MRFERRGDGRTRLADLHQAAPCRCLLPASEDWPTAVFAATCGGLTGGDSVRFDFEVGAGAAARATTQAAERLYRARAGDAPARIESRVVLGEGASAEWLPQETIVYDGARLKRQTVFELADGADLLACELRVLGRAAYGEVVRAGCLSDRIAVWRKGALVWVDALRLGEDSVASALASPVGFGGHPAIATVFYAAGDAEERLGEARAILDGGAATTAHTAATAFDGLLLARFLAPDAFALRRSVAHFITGFRAALGRAPVMPRFWSL